MSYLLYCVFRGGLPPEIELPTGIRGERVLVISYGSLSCGVSEINKLDAAPAVSAVLAYERVVEFFFRRQTIVPMRYGCQVRDQSQLHAVLDARHKEYDALLSELDGLAEMAIKFPSTASEPGSPIDSASIQPATSHQPDRPGVSYLLDKKRYYGSADRMAGERDERIRAVCQALSGVFVRHKVEPTRPGVDAVSIYFLVPRASVELFRKASRQYPNDGDTTLMVSGPWPPYNFAAIPIMSGN